VKLANRLFPYESLDHRTILLYGFHFSFAFIFFLAPIRDLLFGNYFNFTVNSSAFLVTLLSYYLLNFKKRVTLATYLILMVALVPLVILIYYNSFANLVVVYIILLPLAAFFLLDFKRAIVMNIVIYTAMSVLLYIIAQNHPEEPTLHNPLALINIAFASILIMSFGVVYHFSIFQQMQKLVRTNTQKDILLKEVHHRVKNNLNVTASMLGLQAMKADAFTAEELKKSKSRIEAIAKVHEMLYQVEDFERIVFDDYVRELKANVLSIYGNFKDIEIICQGEKGLTVTLDKMIQMALIINELITNTIKHSETSQDIAVLITLHKRGETYCFIYEEKGDKVVETEALKNATGLGVKLIQLSVKQLDASLKIETAPGLRYTIEFEDA